MKRIFMEIGGAAFVMIMYAPVLSMLGKILGILTSF